MKFLVVGAGAVGGVVGARLALGGHDVTVVARGANLDAIRTHGITLYTPEGRHAVRVPAVDRPIVDGHVVLLAVKTQDAATALRDLAIAAPASTPIACLTNGIEAERIALRWFDRVYGVSVYTPATHLEPGVVEAWGTPHAGMFDIGGIPDGSDATCTEFAAAFEASGLSSRVYPDVMRWKRGKLIFNLSNALEALCGPAARTHAIVDGLRAEARAVYAAAKLSTSSDAEMIERRGAFKTGTIEGRTRSGGSTWQSLARGASLLECEFLNGEITMLGRMHGVPTPINDALLREVTRAAASGAPPGAFTLDEIARRLKA